MKPAVVSIAIGSKRYKSLGERQREALNGTALVQFTDELPPGAPRGHPLPWLAYTAKPYAMREAARRGHDLLLWMDASCYPVRRLDSLWGRINQHGHYCQDNGFSVGQWCSDAALVTLGLTREESFAVPEISTCCLGLDMRREDCQSFVDEWCELASDGISFMGFHTNDVGPAKSKGLAYRYVGHVSDDPRVMGTRHDQSCGSVLAHRRNWTLTPRPIFVDYWREGMTLDERTVILNRG